MAEGVITELARIIRRTWTDPTFKQRLLADPVETLRAEGVRVRDGLRVSVVEETADHRILVLPPKPETEVLDDGALAQASGGRSLWAGAEPGAGRMDLRKWL